MTRNLIVDRAHGTYPPRVPRLLLVTASAHRIDQCRECATAAQSATTHARVTGSVGATWTETYPAEPNRTAHSATVHRSRELVTR